MAEAVPPKRKIKRTPSTVRVRCPQCDTTASADRFSGIPPGWVLLALNPPAVFCTQEHCDQWKADHSGVMAIWREDYLERLSAATNHQ